jgi:CBS domain-containing protein
MIDPAQWQQHFADAFARIAGCFGRREPRLNARGYLAALLSDVDSRNGWQLAEQAGHAAPYRMQRLLGEARWDADEVRDRLRRYVVDELGDPTATLIGDDSGDLKSGSHTVGVQRQYTGTAGRIENCQVATYLAYAGPKGRALIDRELYLPKSWTGDRQRCQAAGVPDDVELATKITHLQRMIRRALDAAVPFAWVTIKAEANVVEAARLMEANQIKRLPVVDDAGRLVGIAARRDVLKAFLRPDPAIRDEVIERVFKRVLWMDPTAFTVEVHDGIVTVSGELDRKSTIPMVIGLVRSVDGVVDVIDRLTYRYDDTVDLRPSRYLCPP